MPAVRLLAIAILTIAFFVAAFGLSVVPGRQAGALADRLATSFCRTLLWLLRVRLRVQGTRTTHALILANHVSWIDILALGTMPRTAFLAKEEVARWPIIGQLARSMSTVFVERRRRRSILPANAAIAARLNAGQVVVVFPEGTTGSGHRVGRFGSSHVEAAITARPIGAAACLQPATLAYDDPAAAWIGEDALIPHLWRILRRPPITCLLSYATPIEIDAVARRKPLTAAAHRAVTRDLVRLQTRYADSPSLVGPRPSREECACREHVSTP